LIGIEGENGLTCTNDLVCEVDELCMVVVRDAVVGIDFGVEKSPYAGHKVVVDTRGGRMREMGESAESGCDDDGLEVVLNVEELRGGEKELRGELVGMRGIGRWETGHRHIRGQSTEQTGYPRLVVGGFPGVPSVLNRERATPGFEGEIALALFKIVGEKVVELGL